jgi:hypothetical protein
MRAATLQAKRWAHGNGIGGSHDLHYRLQDEDDQVMQSAPGQISVIKTIALISISFSSFLLFSPPYPNPINLPLGTKF